MSFTLPNSDVIEQLIMLADGDYDLVQEAIWASTDSPDKPADVEKVMSYIEANRGRKHRRVA